MRKHGWDFLLGALVVVLSVILWRLQSDDPSAAAARDLVWRDDRAGLGRRVGAISLDGVSLAQALDALSHATGARIVRSPTIASRASASPFGSISSFYPNAWQSHVSVCFRDLPLRSALDVLIEQTRGRFQIPLTYVARDDGTILIGADDEMPLFVRTYDLGPLLHRMGASEASSEEGTADSPRQQFIAMLYQTAPQDAWPAPLQFFGTRLVVVQNERRFQVLDPVIRELSAIRKGWPGEGEVQVQLQGDLEQPD